MKPAPFEYHAPSTALEATRLLAELGDTAKVLAGGQSLIPMMALRVTAFDHVVDIGRIPELRGIERRASDLWIGAATTQAAVEASETVACDLPMLAKATPLIGHFQIRSRGTVGGSIAHADPAAEYPAVALALGAHMEVMSPDGGREVPASEFFEGIWSTCMEPEELLVGVSFPIWRRRTGFAVEEFARRHGDFALAGCAIGVELDDADCVRRAAIALFGVSPTPVRATAVELEVRGRTLAEIASCEVGVQAVEELESVTSDIHGSADYRKRVAAAMVTRAWQVAVDEARRG